MSRREEMKGRVVRDGPTSMESRGRKSEKEEDRKEPRAPEEEEEAGGDGLTPPVCLRGANGVLQLF